jgi:lipopolysaccharide/colanic/teichoic acid biosynthesis glycosyltransferase
LGLSVDDVSIARKHIWLIWTVDMIGGVSLSVLTLPLWLIICVLIRATSPGPAIYRQQRVGKNGKVFTLYKFRTMVAHAEKEWGFLPATVDDIRITKVGGILRRTRLDELPQLINVLKGDMSLVGPRPENLHRVSMHKALQGARLAVKPGITGLAQVRSLYDLKPDHKLKYDYLYIQKRSVRLNLYILAKTVAVVFGKTGW